MKTGICRVVAILILRVLSVLFTGFPLLAIGGTIITDNLPGNTAIINIDARADGAAAYNGDQSLWYQPFNTGGTLLQYTVQAGAYTFRIVDPADAARLFPALTAAQTNEVYTAWAFNSPWVTDYLVFGSSATNNSSVAQLFDGACTNIANLGPFFANAADAYDAAISNGWYDLIRPGPSGRDGLVFTNGYVFTNTQTLIFVVPDYALNDNAGGVSVLIAPAILNTSNLLLNPGAETGSLTNWTAGGDSNPFAGDPANSLGDGFATHSGSYYFVAGTGSTGSLAQVVALAGNQGLTGGEIDSGRLTAKVSFWEQSLDQGTQSDAAYVALDFWDSASNVISSVATPEIDSHYGSWSNYVAKFVIPSGTRFIRYTMHFVRYVGSDLDAFVDDNSLSVVEAPPMLPRLEVISSGTGTLTLQWPTNAAGYKLEQTTNLASGAWSDVTNVPAVLNTNYSVALPMDVTNRFFRLHFP